jgi:hypothetical protein
MRRESDDPRAAGAAIRLCIIPSWLGWEINTGVWPSPRSIRSGFEGVAARNCANSVVESASVTIFFSDGDQAARGRGEFTFEATALEAGRYL